MNPPDLKKDRRLRIMWCSNSPWSHSGYGKMADAWGSDAMIHHSKHWGAHVVFSMQDLWPVDPNALAQLAARKTPWIPYVPIDMSPASIGVLDRLRYANRIITFSKFGKETIQKKGFVSDLIVEGTDTNIFKPMDRSEVRKKLGWKEDVFVFGMIGANKENPPRKGWGEALEAFKKFSDIHPNSALYVHSNQWFPTGFPIMEYAQFLGIRDKIFNMDQYQVTFHVDSPEVAMLLNAMDCLLQPSMTEGFGLPVIEAQSCGTPVIIQDCTSMTELVIPGKTGEMCKRGRKWFTNQQGYVYFANINSLHEKMETIFKNLTSKKDYYSKAARKNVEDNYSIDKLFVEKWVPYYEKLQTELLGPAPTALQNTDANVASK